MLRQYPMLCSDRYVIVQQCLALADKLGTKHFAHGCTGVGNDQLRFDQSVRSPGDYTIHALIRELQRETSNVRAHELKLMADASRFPLRTAVINQRKPAGSDPVGWK
jgi:argininosuccinate synthase